MRFFGFLGNTTTMKALIDNHKNFVIESKAVDDFATIINILDGMKESAFLTVELDHSTIYCDADSSIPKSSIIYSICREMFAKQMDSSSFIYSTGTVANQTRQSHDISFTKVSERVIDILMNGKIRGFCVWDSDYDPCVETDDSEETTNNDNQDKGE